MAEMYDGVKAADVTDTFVAKLGNKKVCHLVHSIKELFLQFPLLEELDSNLSGTWNFPNDLAMYLFQDTEGIIFGTDGKVTVIIGSIDPSLKKVIDFQTD